MCLTMPHQIISLDSNNTARVLDLKKQEKTVIISALSNLQIGDWLLVNANLAIQKISAKEAEELIHLLK